MLDNKFKLKQKTAKARGGSCQKTNKWKKI